MYLQQAKLEASQAYLERALELQERYQGPWHPDVAAMRANRASVFVGQGATFEARRELQRAIEIWEDAEAAHTRELASALNNMGHLDLLEGKPAEAVRAFRRALALWEQTAPEGPNIAISLGNLGAALHEQGHFDEAFAVLQRGLKVAGRALPSDSSERASLLTELGLVYLGLEKPQPARELLERALAIREVRPGLAADLPRLRFGLAKASLELDAEHATSLAKAARRGYLELPAEHPMRREINEIDAWIVAYAGAAQAG